MLTGLILVLSLESAGAVLAASCCRSAVELAVGTCSVAVVVSVVGLHALLRICSGMFMCVLPYVQLQIKEVL